MLLSFRHSLPRVSVLLGKLCVIQQLLWPPVNKVWPTAQKQTEHIRGEETCRMHLRGIFKLFSSLQVMLPGRVSQSSVFTVQLRLPDPHRAGYYFYDSLFYLPFSSAVTSLGKLAFKCYQSLSKTAYWKERVYRYEEEFPCLPVWLSSLCNTITAKRRHGNSIVLFYPVKWLHNTPVGQSSELHDPGSQW